MGTNAVALKIEVLEVPKFWVQWEGIAKLQAIAFKFCTVITLRPINTLAKFQLHRPKIGELGPKVWGSMGRNRTTTSDRYKIMYIDNPLP